jgi:hypothetical protein
MFVFWYCHKRGKQVRLDREIEQGKAGEANEPSGAAADSKEEECDGSDFDATDSDGGEEVDNDIAEQIATAVKEDRATEDEHAAALKRKEEALNKP